MAETSSSRRSRSDSPRRRRPRQADAEGAKPSRRKGGATAGATAKPDAAGADTGSATAATPRTGSAPSPARELGAQPGRVRIVACHGGTTTESADVKEIAGLLAPDDARVWIDLFEPGPDDVGIVAEALGLHPLIAEDIAERDQRSKVETFDEGVVHIVLFALHYAGEATAAEIDFVLGRKYLLTVHDGALGHEDTAPLRLGADRALQKGADYLLYALADAVVDAYFPVLDKIGDDIDELQDRVMETASDWTLQRLFSLKRELATLRRATSPAREIFAQLTNREVDTIDPKHIVYYRDVYDHLIRVTDELDNDRDLVAGTLDIYVSIVNNDLSRIMKRLTGVTVILAGIGAVAGVFGMSEAGSALSGAEGPGFWLVTVVVLLLAVGAAAVLRRFDWI
ncbi:MAG TPA: magnesium transporter CorA family protein [Candidatus Limnocylindrales bacterium]|nr:magnesium transporter CorA family protein [Candidatus Limnocylindrales bacterium]